jgi:hypothetical protein
VRSYRSSDSQEIPHNYGTQKFITAFTTAYPEPDQSSPCPQFHFPKIHFNIILPFATNLRRQKNITIAVKKICNFCGLT